MAKQTGLFRFTGKLDNVIGYRRNGVHCVRSMPDKVRQTPATRRAAREFGVASRKGKLIRRAITPYLGRHDGSLVNRLNKALVLADGQLQVLKGFRFNPHTGMDKFFALPPVLTAGLVKIPAQALPELPGIRYLEVSVIAARVNFAERRIVEVEAVTEVIDLHRPFAGMQLAAQAGGNGTLIITLQAQACIECNGRLLPMGNRKYRAADIVAVTPPAFSSSRAAKAPRAGWRSDLPPSRMPSSPPSLRAAAATSRAGWRSDLLPPRIAREPVPPDAGDRFGPAPHTS